MTKNAKKIGLVGHQGKMGLEIARVLSAKNLEFQGVTRADLSSRSLLEISVLIDFSVAEAVPAVIDFALKKGIPVVSGTTGPDVENQWLVAAEKIPVLWSSNMSLGVAVLKKSLHTLRALSSQNFDFQIEEIHHRQKKDKPSGTAVTLQKTLESCLTLDQQQQLAPVQSLRLGGVYGIHRVYATSQDESLLFEHQALNRSVFAQGAVTAALWLQSQTKGFYRMEDLLGL